MFKKIIKYDFLPIFKIWWIIAASVLGASFVGAFALRVFAENVTKENFHLYARRNVFGNWSYLFNSGNVPACSLQIL